MGRTEYGFARTACGCRRCTISCEHVPGTLAPADLPRMAEQLGYGRVEAFARENLLASDGVRVTTDRGAVVHLRTLVPATQANGHCKFLDAGRCAVHAFSPYGCAFIDAHQGDAEYARRADALYRDLHQQWQTDGLYAQVWNDLKQRRLAAPPLETRQYRLNKAMRREKLL